MMKSSKEDEKKINDFIAHINNPYYETGYDMMYLNRRALVVGPAFDQDNELTIEEEKKLSPSEIIDRTIHWFVYVVGLDNISELRWPYAIDAIDSQFENNVVHVVPKQNEDSESDTDVQHHHG